MTTKAQDKALALIWIDEFVNDVEGVCGLCGNSGLLDTRNVKSPRGELCGSVYFCICPNGRRIKSTTGMSAGLYHEGLEWQRKEWEKNRKNPV